MSKKKKNAFWSNFKELFVQSLTPAVMYFAASLVVFYQFGKMGEETNVSKLIGWGVAMGVIALAYNCLLLVHCGGNHYEMLASGNLKRQSAYEMGTELNITSYKSEKEYRPWKGFVIGLLSVWAVIAGSILLGANQSKITSGDGLGKTASVFALIFHLLGGYVLIPLQQYNACGLGNVNCVVGIVFALIAVLVSGGAYIGGAYLRRNKRLKEQEAQARRVMAEVEKPKKINYGGLPGTKPNKKK